MASAMKKVNMITKIVRLKQVAKRWKTSSLGRRSILCYSASSSDADDPAASGRLTPSGSVAVYVGPERRRFVIPTRFLNLPVFVDLLNQAEEEFGYQTTGGLALPCCTDFFEEILRFLDEDEERFRGLGVEEFSKMASEMDLENSDPSSCTESSSAAASSSSSHPFTPLLQKARV
ncbi:PREDICTED: auxin-induced protein X10A-like [Erythranthe guttata]|nr:PREDICTED: auxin-induced protein X10A-like [Erythranthe guttata]|eukprot:XP_012835884.1 PREDICTED: auxin-induced protein X10A-like [Erythranthe guttata]